MENPPTSSSPPNIVGACSVVSEDGDRDRTVRQDSDAGYTTGYHPLFDSPPSTLSARPKSVPLPPIDRSELSVAGRRSLEARPDSGMTDVDSIERKIKSLEQEINHLSAHKLSFSAERETSVKPRSERRHQDRSTPSVGAASSELLFTPNAPPTADVTLAASPFPTATRPSPASFVGVENQGTTAVSAAHGNETAPNRSLPTIKLDAYDGSTPLQTHLSKLSNCASYYNWGPRDRLCHLKASLVGQAGEVLWQLTDDSTEADVVRLLKNRFGSDHQTERYRLELQGRRRKNGESIQSVYNDVRRLLALSFPGHSGNLCEILGMDYFLSALADPALRIRVLDQSPKNLDEALVIAARMEVYSGVGTSADGSTTDSDRGKVQEVKHDTAERDDKRWKELRDELASYRRQIQQLKADNEFWRNRVHEQPTVPPPPPAPAWSSTAGSWSAPPSQPISMPPDMRGMSQQPPSGPMDNPWNQSQQSSSYYGPPPQQTSRRQYNFDRGRGRGGRGRGRPLVDSDTCRICFNRGHWSYSCPNRSTSINGVSDSNRESYTYFTAVLNGKKTPVLLDSGACCNLIPHRLVKGLKLDSCDMLLFAANGSKIQVLGALTVDFMVCGMFLSARFIVTETVDTPIVGYSWMNENECCWMFGKSSITVRGVSVPLTSKPSDVVNVRRVYIHESVEVPVDHVARIPVDLPACSFHTPAGSWLIEPKEIRPGLLLSRSLMSDEDVYPAVQLINISDKPQILPAGLNLGLAELSGGITSLSPPPACMDVTPLCAHVAGPSPASPGAVNTAAATKLTQPAAAPELVEVDKQNGDDVSSSDATSETAGNFDHMACMFDSLPVELNDDDRERVISLLKRNVKLFARDSYDIGRTKLIEAEINTTNHAPIYEPMRRHAKAHLGLIDEAVENLQAAGLVQESTSPWASNLVIVQKPNGQVRVTTDLRRLNSITSRQNFAMPHISDSLDFLSQAKYLTVLDCTQSYFHIPLKESDRPKTAFHTRRGLMEWCVLPQGSTNSPAIFSRLISLTLRGLSYLCVLSFIDDICVASRTFEEHLLSLELVFNRLKYAGLKLKPSKCKLLQSEVTYLGFKVTGNTIRTDETKTACISSWQFPKNISELRSLIGFFSYYRIFLENFASRIEPLNEMLRKNEAIVPTKRRLDAFQDLKSALLNAPILGIYRPDGEIVVDVDTSLTSCGAVCSQFQDNVLRPLFFASRCLSKSERNLCAYRREMLGLIFALKKFRPYLLGLSTDFRVRVDNMALKNLLSIKNPTGQLARHLDLIADYRFTLEHRPGKWHQNCDSLSRLRPCSEGIGGDPCKQCRKLVTGEHINVVTRSQAAKIKPLFAPLLKNPYISADDCVEDPNDAVTIDDDDSYDDVVDDFELTHDAQLSAQNDKPPIGLLGRTAPNAAVNLEGWDPSNVRIKQLQDPDIANALTSVETDTKPSRAELQSMSPALRSLYYQYDSLCVVQGVLYRMFYDVSGSVQHYQVVLPHSLKYDFLELIHNDMCGHLGAKKCKPQVQKFAWWHKWKNDVDLFVQCCAKCASYHRGQAPKQGLLHPMIVDEVGSRWSIDLCGPFPISNNYSYILTAICVFSKYAIAVPIRNKSAKTVARVIVERVLLTHSLPTEILTDNGGEFCNELADQLYRLLGIHRLHTTSRKVSTNGGVERLHRTLNSILAKIVNDSHTNWSAMITYATFCYNICEHSATGLSPFYVVYGRQPHWNMNLLLHNVENKMQSVPQYTADVINRLRSAHNTVRQKLGLQAQYMSQWYNKKVKPATFAVGDKVRIFNDSSKQGRCPKWQHFYQDLGTVVRRINDVSYVISCPSWRCDRIIHVDKLKSEKTFPK